jgi:ribosome biogenesis protein Nip4
MTRTFAEFCKQFTSEDIPDVVKIGKRYFYDPLHLLKVTQEHKWDAFSVGLYLGEEKKEFQATSALIDLLAQKNEKRVIVGSKAAWLFLCGRDILMDGVFEAGEFAHNELAFVADHNGNVLGYGTVVAPYNTKMKNKTYVKHRLDKGEYLHRERMK